MNSGHDPESEKMIAFPDLAARTKILISFIRAREHLPDLHVPAHGRIRKGACSRGREMSSPQDLQAVAPRGIALLLRAF